MPYPHELESWWLAAACRATGTDNHAVALAQLEPMAAHLSDQFTTARPQAFSDYSADPASLAAYGVMFFPQTFARVSLVISECLPIPLPSNAAMHVLDLGSGTGASSLAMAINIHHPMMLHAVDHAPAALSTLRQIFYDCHQLWPAAALTTHVCNVRADDLPGRFDLILASFVLNELFAPHDNQHAEQWLRRQLNRLAPGGTLIVIEPAGTATCERLQYLRDKLASADACDIIAPCPHRLPCPMRVARTGYCHDVRRWCVPDSVNLINRRLFRSVHDLKYGLLAIRRTPIDTCHARTENQQPRTKNHQHHPPPATLHQPPSNCHPPPATTMRLVAPVFRTKGRILSQGCCSDGLLRAIEWPTRHLTREQLEALLAKERGDILPLENARLLGNGKTWRVEPGI